jgi:glycosyltransferase involved in cell wall biosynthesis
LVNLGLVLFFTRGVSLRNWDKWGMFDREVALYQRLRERGVQVTFVTYGNRRDLKYTERLPGINVLCNRWKKLSHPVYERLLPLIHAPFLRRCDIVKTNQTPGSEVALRSARLWGKPLLARCGYMWSEFAARDQGVDSAAARHARHIESKVFSAAAKVAVTTPTIAADIGQRVPAAAAKTTVIPNYVEIDRFCPAAGQTRDFDIIFVGRLAPQKNLSSLLEAVAPLGLRVLVVGDGKLRDELQQRFARANNQIEWLGNVSNADLPIYLNRARLFVLPSHYEGHPKALIEAMACGLPVIGADSPGISELIRHRETGWLCGTDASSIRAAVQQLLAEPELCAKLGSNAHRYVLEHFSLDRIVEMEVAVLEEVTLQ